MSWADTLNQMYGGQQTETKKKKKTGWADKLNALYGNAPETPTPQYNTAETPTPHNIPDFLGGGALYPTNLGQPEAFKTYGGVNPVKGSERDHTVPYALGGASTRENIRIEKILNGKQAPTDPLELKMINKVKSGEISRGEAIGKILSAKRQQTGLEPTKKEQTTWGQIGNVFKDYLGEVKKYIQHPNTNAPTPKPDNNLVQQLYKRGYTKKGIAKKLGFKENDIPKQTFQIGTGLNKKEQQTAQKTVTQQIKNQAEENKLKAEEDKKYPLGNVNTHPFTTVLGVGTMLALPEAMITAPVSTAVYAGLWSGIHKITDKLNLKLSNLSDKPKTKDALDALQMVAEGGVAHGIYKKTPQVFDALTKDIVSAYGMPEKYTIPAEKIKDIFQSGKKATPLEQQLFGQVVQGDRAKIHDAIKNGININVPATEITRMVDKPWWGKVKKAIGTQPFDPMGYTVRVKGEAPTGKVANSPIAGLLPEGKTPKVETPKNLSPIEKAIKPIKEKSVKPQGKVIPKDLEQSIKEAKAKGLNIREFVNKEMQKKYPNLDFSDRGDINRMLESQMDAKRDIKNKMDILRAKIIDKKLSPQKVNRIEEIRNSVDNYTEKVRMVEDYPDGYSIGRVLETPVVGGKGKYGIYKNGKSLVGDEKRIENQKDMIKGFFNISEDDIIKENPEFAKLWKKYTAKDRYNTNKMHDEYSRLEKAYTQYLKQPKSEIKAKIRGEAPKIETSGKMFEEKPKKTLGKALKKEPTKKTLKQALTKPSEAKKQPLETSKPKKGIKTPLKKEISKKELFSTHYEKLKKIFGISDEGIKREVIHNKESIKKAFDFLQRNPQKAMRVVYGLEPAPLGQNLTHLRQSAYTSLLEAGKESQAREIMRLESTGLTQTARELQAGNSDLTPERQITKNITNKRLEKIGKKLGETKPEKAVERAEKKIKTEAKEETKKVVKNQVGTDKELDDFLNSIIC